MNRISALANGQVEAQEDWQAKVARLEESVCSLLLQNQTLRMALQAERAKAEGCVYPDDFFAGFSIG